MKKDVIWGLLDQGLQSLINLVIGATLIHFAIKEEYGLYGIGFATQLLLIGLSNALVSTPMTVIAPSKDTETQDDFCCGLIIGFFKLFIPFVTFFVASVFLIDQVYSLSSSLYFICAIALSSPCVIFIEIIRRYFYIKQNPKSVFLMDLVYAFIYIVSLTMLLYLTRKNLHIYALIISGVSSLIASSIFYMRSEMNFYRGIKIAKNCIKEAWNDGKWALGGIMISWGQNQGYVYILALMKSSAIVAEANAARLFLAPISVISLGLSKVAMPRIVKLKIDGKIDEALKLARVILLVMVGFIIGYGLFISLVKDWIIDNFIQKDYLYLDVLIVSWTIYFLCQAFRNNNSILMQAFRYFKEITISSAWTSVGVLILSVFVAKFYEINYVVLVMSLGELFLAVLLWKRFNNSQLPLTNKDISITSERSKSTEAKPYFSLILYICTAIVVVQIIFFTTLIQWGGSFLSAPEDMPEKSDLIVILGGGTGERLKKGLDLYQAGYAPKVLLTGLPEMDQKIQPTYSIWRQKYLIEQNVPERAILIDNSARNSLDEAVFVKELTQKSNWNKVIVVSDPPHLRRLSLIYNSIFAAENSPTIYLTASRPTWWDADQWWHNSIAAQFVLLEVLKIANFYFVSSHKPYLNETIEQL